MLSLPRSRTPLPARPAVTSVALESTHGLLEALVQGDLSGAEALIVPTACVWWPSRGGIASLEGARSLALALMDLLDGDPPTQLAVVPSGAHSTVTSAYVEDAFAWSLELRVEDGAIAGAYLRRAPQRLRRYSPPTA